jgi:hypothetical protein
MSQELHYTSVPRGLKPGSRGFGAVGVTADLPDLLAERLESLSGYRAVYPPGDPSVALNPVVHAHVRLTVGGRVLDVLSRIGPAGLDYSGRPNKYAHHVVLDAADRPEGGPAWLLSQPGFLQSAWKGEPRILPQGRPVPRGDRPAAIAEAWHALTGDAGWAGVLAESYLADPRRPVFLVFRPGMDLLPLFVEAIALLPASRRWDVELSTYFTTLPQGVTCNWRGVLDGSAEAKNARRLPSALIVDLCRPVGRARGDDLVHLARTGERRETSSAEPQPPSDQQSSRKPPLIAGPPRLHTGELARGSRPGVHAGQELLPDLAARLMASELLLSDGDPVRKRRQPRTTLIATVVAACLVPLTAAGIFWSPVIRTQLGFEPAMKRTTGAPGVQDSTLPKDPVARQDALHEDKKVEGETVVEEAAAKLEPHPLPTVAKAPEAAAKSEGKAAEASKPAANTPPNPIADAPRTRGPVVLAFALPAIPRSQFGGPIHQARELGLPEDVVDRFEMLNATGLRVVPPTGSKPWEIATKTGISRLDNPSTLAQLVQKDARTWRFDWTKDASKQAIRADALRDAVLRFQARDGQPIFALLRAVEPPNHRPLVIVDNQPLLFDRLDPRTRPVTWTRNPEALEGAKWKLSIRRWRLVISRPVPDAEPSRREFHSAPLESEKDERSPGVKTEQDLVRGEVTLKLSIDPESPDSITVRLVPDREKVVEGRKGRAARLNTFKESTPKGKEGRESDPIEYRRDQLRELEAASKKDNQAIQKVKGEISELKALDDIRQIEDLLAKPVRAELSVVIGLDVDDSTILEIARIGEFED